MTLLTDSVRLLRARVLFWVTLWISVLAALLYSSIGFDETGYSLAFGLVHFNDQSVVRGSLGAEILYLKDFSDYFVGIWLSWLAVGLAIFSSASIFPDFMSEGSIGIPLSKPVSRLTLFLCKYVGSLLFVVLQVTLFCLIVLVAMRVRIGFWNPSVFWAVPLVTLMYSYIYSVVVLVSVKTRSVLAAVLAGFFVWFLAFGAHYVEEGFYWATRTQELSLFTDSGHHPKTDNGHSSAASSEEDTDWKRWHDYSEIAVAAMPKTSETTQLMDRLMTVKGPQMSGSLVAAQTGQYGDLGEVVKKIKTRHSPFYIIGTSLGFEAVMLALAAWIFCRRDY